MNDDKNEHRINLLGYTEILHNFLNAILKTIYIYSVTDN